jgi:hypothetical protein
VFISGSTIRYDSEFQWQPTLRRHHPNPPITLESPLSRVYNRCKFRILNGTTDFDVAVLRIMLVQSGYVFDPDHNTLSDITSEITVGGYARQTLTGVVPAENDTLDAGGVVSDHATFAGLTSGQTVDAAVIFHRLGGTDDAADPLVSYHRLTSGIITNGGDVIIRFDLSSPGAFLRVDEF